MIEPGDIVTLTDRGINKGLYKTLIDQGMEITAIVEKISKNRALVTVRVIHSGVSAKWHSTFWRKKNEQ